MGGGSAFRPWAIPSIFAVFSAYLYVFSEWLFFATKPSMFSVLGPADQAAVAAIAPLFLVLPALAALLVLGAAGWLLRRWLGAPGRILLVVPALALTATEILLVENFTYTLFGFNVGSFSGVGRFVYLSVFLFLFGWTLRALVQLARSRFLRERAKLVVATAFALLALSAGAAALRASSASVSETAEAAVARQRPNVLVLASDGIRGRNMSAYGYGRDTTPFIRSLLDESRVFENHFTNSGSTTGAIGSLLSGKLPTQTRVISRPDVFAGGDAYEHLPAVLRTLGYRSGDFSVRHYADAYDLNLRDGFHYANSRSLTGMRGDLALPRSLRMAWPAESLFVEQSRERIEERVLHAAGLRVMTNPYAAVMQLHHTGRGTDRARVDDLLRFIEGGPEPFFAHVHLMGTHGAFFHPRERVFSRESDAEKEWSEDGYDDAIRDFDRYVEEVVNFLARSGRLERTLLILNSDHGQEWSTTERLPLIIRFPGGAHAGRVEEITQRVDIAPTVLAAVGAGVPNWMAGVSLAAGELDPMRPVFVTDKGQVTNIGGWWQTPDPSPPFYTLRALSLFRCQRWYRLDLVTSRMRSGEVSGYTAPCPNELLPSDDEARHALEGHLEEQGYDISSLRRH
jgi:hypothetical protein